MRIGMAAASQNDDADDERFASIDGQKNPLL